MAAATRSIEAVVLGFIVVTLAYFQLLHAVKHSEFLNPANAPSSALAGTGDAGASRLDALAASAVFLVKEGQQWSELPQTDQTAPDVQLVRILVSLDAELAPRLVEEDDRNILVYPSAPSHLVAADSSHDPRFERIQLASSTASAGNATLLDQDTLASLRDFENYIKTSPFGSTTLRFAPDLCQHLGSSTECFVASFDPAADPSGKSRSAVLTLAFTPSHDASEWSHHVLASHAVTDSHGYTYAPLSAAHSKREDTGLGLNFKAFPGLTSSMSSSTASTAQSSQDSRSIKWMLYAGRAFVTRFYALARKADSADIFVMLIGYLLMHLTFINLFINMRKLGSKFWLGCSTLVSGTFALLLALFTAYLLGISINPIILSEALPFLVITVGFEKPFVLAKSVFQNPSLTPLSGGSNNSYLRSRVPSRLHLATSSTRVTASGHLGTAHADTDELASEPLTNVRSNGIRWGAPVPARDIVIQGFDKSGKPIVRDYAVEIAVLLAGSFAGVPGLKEFCQLAALILFFDCLFLFGFFASVLTVMVEVRRIRVMRGLRKVDSSADLAHILDDGTTPSVNAPEESPASQSAGQKLRRLVLGSSADDNGSTEEPTARLKLLLITAFLILHALNLLTTLTAKTAITRHSAASSPSPAASSVPSSYHDFLQTDPASPTLAPILAQLASSFPSKTSSLVVQIPPPILFRLMLPGHGVEEVAKRAFSAVSDRTKVGSSMAILDRFMSGWTKLVGDPVLSKWIVIVLIVSVFLNGYLLKGIALGDAGTGEGFVPSSAPEAATRLLLRGKLDSKEKKIKRRWSGGVEGLSRFQTEWTLADAAEMAKERRKELIETEKERDAAQAFADKSRRQKNTLANGHDSSDDSPPGSPLFMTTKKSRTPHVAGRLVSANEEARNGMAPPMVMTPASENGKIVTPFSNSETSSEAATETPATTIVDDTEHNTETPTVQLVPATPDPSLIRPVDEVATIFDHGKGANIVSDEEIILLVQKGKVAAYALEKLLKDNIRAVCIRRALISRASTSKTLEKSDLPYMHYDYSKVIGQCCENVIGYTPIPIGVAGPLRIDGTAFPIPMATTEGALVASTSRGCKALNAGGGVTTVVTQDGMTRGPALEFPNVTQCAAAKRWIDSEEGSTIMKAAFNSTTRFGRLNHLKAAMAGRTLFVRFMCQTGDAMGMNMISKGTERALETMGTDHFPEMRITSLSGNYCTDKKPAAINWIEGRGKSVVAEGIVPGNIVKTILKTTVKDLVRVNIAKNLIGSAMAGTMGGNNAHSSNILTAIYLATGQDPAQNVESANCMTLMEAINDGQDLLITCTMPSIEVGTIGGGTILPPQHAMLQMLGVNGPHATNPGDNARRLARIICAAVVAGELSLMSSLAQGSLVQSHMALNRSAPATPATMQVTHHTFLTPAPTRPGTPSPRRPAAGLPGLTPLSNSTLAAK